MTLILLILSVSKNSLLQVFDIRTSKPVSSLKYDSEFTATCLCKWPLAPYVGIGFDEGIVSIIDTRMFLPIKSMITNSPKQIIPIYGSNISFAIASNGLHCYSLGSGRFLSFNKGNDVVICEYDGGIVCLDEVDAYYITPLKPEKSCLVFDPKRTCELEYKNNQLFKPVHRPRGRSLHQHPIQPLCICKTKEYFVSFDQLGFCNIWNL